MRVVLTTKRVVGHVMRYPGEVVELPDPEPTDAVQADEERDDGGMQGQGEAGEVSAPAAQAAVKPRARRGKKAPPEVAS